MWQRFPLGSPELRTRFDVWPRPAYAYGVWRAAELARWLGLTGMTVAEFGVAGGSGLVALERVAEAMAFHVGIGIDVLGLDSGRGNPAPADLRDLPYVWANTVPVALEKLRYPVGFIAFDLDYYSSTMQAFRVFDGALESRLPCVFCYFDDLIWPEHDCTGEYAAIRDFNDRSAGKKISQMVNLRWTRARSRAWNEQMYVLHDFEHPLYCKNITPPGAEYRQLALDA
jgi:hypothetical protein